MAADIDFEPRTGPAGKRRAGGAHTAKPHSRPLPHAPLGVADEARITVPDAPGKRAPRPPLLDARLRAAADWVDPCGVCADIGCDHGRLGAALLTENRCQTLLAADVSEKALGKAKARLNGLGLASRTVFAAADGLAALDALPDGRADTVCILGMGGETLAGILARGQSRLQGATLVLGAQTELPLLRKALYDIGYRLAAEHVAQADGRLYILMLAVPAPEGAPQPTERELLLGPCLLRDLPPAWAGWLRHRQALLQKAVGAMRSARAEAPADRLAALELELSMTAEALAAVERSAAGAKPRGEAAL